VETNVKTVIAELKSTTIAQLIRQVAAIVIAVTPIWLFLGDWVESYADEAFTNMMVKQKPFKELTDKVGKMDSKVDGLSNDLIAMKQQNIADLNTLKQQNKEIQDSAADNKKLLEKLLDLQLRGSGSGR